MTNKIIGIGKDFALVDSLRDAASVTLVMAFAKMSGWNAIKGSLLAGNAQVDILVGLNFAITEPAVLEEWIHLGEREPYRFSFRVAPIDPVFHPKVILVERSGGDRFGIIGSGNLTSGGLITNVECGVFIRDKAYLDELSAWCAELARAPLTLQVVEQYKKIYSAVARANRQSRKAEVKLNRLLGHSQVEIGARPLPVWNMTGFLKDMDDYLATNDGAKSLQDRIEGARRIRLALDMPNFNFNKAGWEDFYGIVEFGSIRQSYKAMSSETPKLRKILWLLTADPLMEETLDKILAVDGEHHVRGLGTNLVSKILTVVNRHRWPVFNHPVKKAFEHYGWSVDWGASHYLSFAATVRQVLSRRGRPDFWALDVFCEWTSRNL